MDEYSTAYEFALQEDTLNIGYGTYNDNLHFDHYSTVTLNSEVKYECGQNVVVTGDFNISQGSLIVAGGTPMLK